jgi:hypothetical protein
LLLIVVGVVTVGSFKKWWVPGWMYADCVKQREKLEAAAEDEMERMRLRLSVLDQDRPTTRRRTAP